MISNMKNTKGGFSKKLIWTNANPTSSFAKQTIPFDTTKYDRYIVKCLRRNNLNAIRYFIVDIDAEHSDMNALSITTSDDNYKYFAIRKLKILSNGFNFFGGYEYSSETLEQNNYAMIPQAIWGVKLKID